MKTTLNLCCLLAVAALAACGNSNGSTTGAGTGGTTTTTGSASGTTSGVTSTTSSSSTTSGTLCSAGAASCAITNCCVTGYTCNANKVCQAVVSGTTSGSTSGVAGSTTSGGACALAAAGGTCTTSFDCVSPNLCISGTCAAGVAGETKCTKNGSGPSAGAPCCESLIDAGGVPTCGAWVACEEANDACTSNADCCSGLNCDPTSNTCIASCGGLIAACSTNADCCANQGLVCTPGSIFSPPIAGGVCFPAGLPGQAVPSQAGAVVACAPFAVCAANTMASEIECQLDAFCDAWASEDAGFGDPCATDGLVCDTSYSANYGGAAGEFGACDEPGAVTDSNTPTCLPGGPACQPLANSTAQIDCEQSPFTTLPGYICDQACQATTDCIDSASSCLTSQGLDLCVTNSCTSTEIFKSCPAAATNDGLCAPLGALGSTGFVGLCFQASTDGGGPGDTCRLNANRQQGGFCDNADVCISGICGAVCNSGTSGVPGCPAGQTCVASGSLNFETADPQDFGGCVTPCDFTDAGAGCGTNSANVATKCIPGEVLNYGPASATTIVDMCSPEAANPIAVGDSCANVATTAVLDPCVPGAFCLSDTTTMGFTCFQLCENGQLGQTGAPGGCPDTYTCTAINFTGAAASTHAGFCQPPAPSTTTTTGSSGTTTGAAATTGATTSAAATTGAASTTGGTTATTGTGTTGGSTTGAASTTGG